MLRQASYEKLEGRREEREVGERGREASAGEAEGCISSRNVRGARDMAVKERRKSVASTKGASWRRKKGVEAKYGRRKRARGREREMERVEEESREREVEETEGVESRGRGRWFERARIIFAEKQALPLFVVAGGTPERNRGGEGLKIRGEEENDG